MVETVRRVAQRDWFVEDSHGNRQDVRAGKDYEQTKKVWDDNTVTLFSRFWVRVPADVFGVARAMHAEDIGLLPHHQE
jgi:hypothetical protein